MAEGPASPRALEALLRELAALEERREAGEPLIVPLVTLHLASGRELDGFVLALGDERQDRTVVLRRAPQGRSPPRDLAFVPRAAIEAVTVHDAEDAGAASADAPPAPTRLAVRRGAAALSSRLEPLLGRAVEVEAQVPEEPEPLRLFDELLGWLPELIEALAKDELGRAALRAKVGRLTLSSGSEPGCRLSDGALELTAPLSQRARLSKPELKKRLEALL